MEIVDVELEPMNPAHVTPLELIEDFADVVPNWHYLEEDSRLYAAVRGRPACVIRACEPGQPGTIDYAFASRSEADSLALRLAILCDPDGAVPVIGSGRSRCVERFVSAFNAYLRGRGTLVRVQQISGEPADAISA